MRHPIYLALLCALLTTTAAEAQWRGRGRLFGKVTDENGKPIAGAAVRLTYLDSGSGPTTETNAKGKFKVGALKGGEWEIGVEAEGFAPVRYQVTLKETGKQPTFEIEMPRPKMVRKKSPDAERNEALRRLLAKADAAFQAGDFATARVEYQKVLDERPELTQIERSIAICQFKEGDLDAALALLQTFVAAQEEPSTDDLMLLANLQLEKNDLAAGLATLERVDRSQVTEPSTFANVGVILYNQQKPDQAIVWFESAIEIDPDFANAYYYLGLARIQKGDTAAAKGSFEKYLEIAPEGPNAAATREVLKAL